ncbi:GAF domain-containing protein [Saccharomonospora sp. NB11]|uniref:GAF domain-containing protein n=1 Tax=Saccharomonospora sp. NB11 TaxID=1642298 RepID=UPI0018D0D066|nr:GAF domain-containing protein [Saccharomonospora sp. NB11]
MSSSAEAGGREQRMLRPTPATRPLARLKLDELLAGVQSRLTEISRTSDRLQSLLDAVLAVSGQLDVDATLRRTVRAAMDLVEARSGALTVLDPEGGAPDQVAIDLDRDDRESDDPGDPVDATELSDTASALNDAISAIEVPQARTPESRTTLAVPVRVRDEPVGTLYVSRRRGGGEFSDDDEIVLRSLAASAGVAVENARLFEQSRVRGRWLEAVTSVNAELLSGASPDRSLQRLAEVAGELSRADAAVVLLDEGDGELSVGGVYGPVPRLAVGELVAARGVLTDVLRTVEPAVLDDLRDADTRLPAGLTTPFGPAVVAPLRSAEGVQGVLLALRRRGVNSFTRQEMTLVASFAAQATVALRFADKQESERAIALLADRDRIASDLHDHVIQRLFAIGMGLQSVSGRIRDPHAAERVQDAVRRLDQTVREIRTSIFNLHSLGTSAHTSLRRRLLDIASSPPSGVATPSVRIGGALDTLVDDSLGRDVEAVAREGVGRLARHAVRADEPPEITLDVDVGDQVTVDVLVEGAVPPSDLDHSAWLEEIQRRAHDRGGAVHVDATESSVRLIWTVPLPDPDGPS